MIADHFTGSLIKALKDKQQQLKDDLATANISTLYELGKIQGLIDGLNQAEGIVEQLYLEQDQ